MAKTTMRLDLDTKGIGQMLKSPEIIAALRAHGQKVARQAKSNSKDSRSEYSVRAFRGRDRARVHVATANPAAMADEARNRALTRAQGVR